MPFFWELFKRFSRLLILRIGGKLTARFFLFQKYDRLEKQLEEERRKNKIRFMSTHRSLADRMFMKKFILHSEPIGLSLAAQGGEERTDDVVNVL